MKAFLLGLILLGITGLLGYNQATGKIPAAHPLVYVGLVFASLICFLIAQFQYARWRERIPHGGPLTKGEKHMLHRRASAHDGLPIDTRKGEKR